MARIYHDLQNINRHEVNADNTVDSTSTRRPLSRPSWGSMYDGVQDEPDEDENDVSSSTFFKTAGNKKFNPVEHIASEIVNSSGGSSLFQGDDDLPMFPYENASNQGLDSLASLGAVGGGVPMENANKKVNEEAGGAGTSVSGVGGQKPQNVVAVPKNIQRNIISRERDDRRKVRRTEKPRNMMNEMMAVDVNQMASFNEAGNDLNNVGASAANSGGSQSEMAEADQLQLPGDVSVDPSAFDIQPLEIGLDRVPTRLSSSELEARRQEEEDNLQNIVDEVLNSSSEADFVHGNGDQPPSPR